MIFTFFLIAVIILARIFFGSQGFYWAFGSIQLLIALMHFVVLLRTRNILYLVLVLFYFFMFLTFLPPFEDLFLHTFFAAMAGLFLIGMIGVFISKKINWRYREILELAALPVNESADGFTERPFPSGQANYSRKEILGLTRFLIKFVVAYPFIEEDRIVFVIPRYMWNFLLYLKRNYENETYVAFNDSGQVTVRIARVDYQSYKDELTFDQLCASLGNLFKQFIQMYQEGGKEKIIERLNAVEMK